MNNRYNNMKQARKRTIKAFKLISFALAFIFSLQAQAQGDPAKGKSLFKANCAACHKMEGKLVGPGLKGVTEKRESAWLKSWIKDSQAFIKTGDADAKAIFDEYKIPMTAFPNFSDADLDNVIAYIANPSAAKKKAAAATGEMPANVKKGKDLFKAQCAACHKLDGKLVGPGLRNVGEKRSKEWLHSWVKDSQAFIKTGDADAKAIFDEYKIPMTAFPNMSNEDIDAIIAYTSYVAPKKAATTAGKTDVVEHKTDLNPKKTNAPLWILLALIIAAVVLKRTKAKGLVFVLLPIILLLGAWVTYAYLMQIGVDEGYQPVQPIVYSHKIHAGDNGIDCNYCHSSAKDSKTSGIPSLNVCMNCHKSIDKVAEDTKVGNLGKKELDKEIAKLYSYVGWDTINRVIVPEKSKPIKWTRIHRLPDFVYFNHSQHVSVQGVSCQKCHGEIQEMDEVFQAKPLTMKWCVDCHRTTDVKMDNKYYEDIHKELSKKYNKKTFTEADMGGLECAKCHY